MGLICTVDKRLWAERRRRPGQARPAGEGGWATRGQEVGAASMGQVCARRGHARDGQAKEEKKKRQGMKIDGIISS